MRSENVASTKRTKALPVRSEDLANGEHGEWEPFTWKISKATAERTSAK